MNEYLLANLTGILERIATWTSLSTKEPNGLGKNWRMVDLIKTISIRENLISREIILHVYSSDRANLPGEIPFPRRLGNSARPSGRVTR